jgi:Ca2+-binding RTX toxin-like protein
VAGAGAHTSEEDATMATVFGTFLADRLNGTSASDVIYGLGGNDQLTGGAGADHLDGGAGIDTADYRFSPSIDGFSGIFVDLGTNTAAFNDAHGDTFTSIENIFGSAYQDVLVGNSFANLIRGHAARDLLYGLGGNDRLEGGDGDDYLNGGDGADMMWGDDGHDEFNGGAGADSMFGGIGNDLYYVTEAGDTVIENAGQGSDRVVTSVSYALPSGSDVEALLPLVANGTGPLDLTGNGSGNLIGGNDGSNVIAGGDGNDELTGRAGQDSFLFDSPLNAAFNLDVITDFNAADDTILLDQTIFSSSLGLGNISSSELVIGAAAQDANDRIIYNPGNGALSYDSDGVGGTAAIQFAALSAGLVLTDLDFLVV